jgi:hypothetical protein
LSIVQGTSSGSLDLESIRPNKMIRKKCPECHHALYQKTNSAFSFLRGQTETITATGASYEQLEEQAFNKFLMPAFAREKFSNGGVIWHQCGLLLGLQGGATSSLRVRLVVMTSAVNSRSGPARGL